ncbi:leucine aminopeptidase 1 [Kalaharituber pfeilii]|nr:leucine aminopeptidase 1 [Kalaharituber pfeilii]
MKYLTLLSLLFSSTALGFVVLPTEQQQRVFGKGLQANQNTLHASAEEEHGELRLIQLSPVETKWVTEEDKLELKRQGINFMDITDHQDLSVLGRKHKKPHFPPAPQQQFVIHPILANLTTEYLVPNLREFTSFYTRYYKSHYGKQSSEWLQNRISATAPGISVTPFKHSWPQSSLIAVIPGRTKKTVVIGAHQDSINAFLPSLLGAPGADDDGSGTVTILEALRVIAGSDYISQNGGFENTLEFHWYSAEEGGLLGSQAIFSSYARQDRDVVAMLQQDMTGFVKRTIDAKKPESVGVVTDYVDPDLTEFIKKVIDEYCDIPWVETKCGYACSDHASATKAGYPSAFVIETEFGLTCDKIHTTEDKMDSLSPEHMVQHAKLTVGLAVELAMAKF